MRLIHFPLFFAPVFLFGAPSGPVRDFWFSGAEISRYALEQARYGAQHAGHAELIFVTEPFLVEEQVKHEFGEYPSTDVLKLNALRTFNTGIYSYRTMTSTFFPVDLEQYGHALKTNTSVQDWCGQVFQQINRKDGGWRGELFSYFQKEGDATFGLPDVWLEDELWVLLRLDPAKLPQGKLEIVPGALYTRFAHKPVRPADATARVEVGPKRSNFVLNYPELRRELRIVFDTAFPHIIRGWTETTPDGTTTATLEDRIMHSEYWNQNQPEDGHLRGKLGLEAVSD